MAGRERGPEPAGAGRPAQGLTLTGQGAKHAERPAVPQSWPLSRLRMRRGGREFFWIGKFHREIHFPPNASSCRGEHRPPMYKSRKDPSAAVKMDFPENFKFTLYNSENICYTVQSSYPKNKYVPVAQLDSALDSDSKGRRFESCLAYQTPRKSYDFLGVCQIIHFPGSAPVFCPAIPQERN